MVSQFSDSLAHGRDMQDLDEWIHVVDVNLPYEGDLCLWWVELAQIDIGRLVAQHEPMVIAMLSVRMRLWSLIRVGKVSIVIAELLRLGSELVDLCRGLD